MGTDLIVQTILALQQLVLEIEVTAKLESHPGDNLNTRLVNVLMTEVPEVRSECDALFATVRSRFVRQRAESVRRKVTH